MEGRALQDVLKVHCYGCGSLNAQGLQIKSHWEGDELVCRWRPQPQHIGHPGIVYGGIIACVVDCHSVWTATATWCGDSGIDLGGGQVPFTAVTGKLTVNFLKPASIDDPLELHARVTDVSERRANVTCRVLQNGLECANADVVVVRIATVS